MLTRIKCLLSITPVELAMIMDRLYGGVCYAGIDTDPELKYPKGAGRVAFSNQQSYIAAISARFVQLQHNDIDKRVSEFTLPLPFLLKEAFWPQPRFFLVIIPTVRRAAKLLLGVFAVRSTFIMVGVSLCNNERLAEAVSSMWANTFPIADTLDWFNYTSSHVEPRMLHCCLLYELHQPIADA